MDSLAETKLVTTPGPKIDDLEAKIKKLMRSQVVKEKERHKITAAASKRKKEEQEAEKTTPLKDELAAAIDCVIPLPVRDPDFFHTRRTFRCSRCGLICRDIIPMLYPLSQDADGTYRGRDIIGHVDCLYRLPDTRRHVLGDNGLVTLMLRDMNGANFRCSLIKSAFVCRSRFAAPETLQDSYCII